MVSVCPVVWPWWSTCTGRWMFWFARSSCFGEERALDVALGSVAGRSSKAGVG